MAQTLTDIAQLAILHCGVSKNIANVLTEKSIEAQACRTVEHVARQTTLRSRPWSFAKKFIVPGLVSGPSPMATVEWVYAYRGPSDMLQMIRFISPRLNRDTRQSRIDYVVVDDAAGPLIYTNWPGNFANVVATIEYTSDNKHIPQWTSDFVLAMSYYMAYLITPVITSGDPYQLQTKLLSLFDAAIKKASSADANQDQPHEEPQSEFVRARDGFGVGSTQGQRWEADGGGFSVE